jgi:predicted Zn finger-like uncharacterized protein
MILDCPLCRTRYLVPAATFAAGPRQVRCARCKHGWNAELPKEIDVVAMPEQESVPVPETVIPIPQGSNLPALTKKPLKDHLSRAHVMAAAFLALLLIGLILYRESIIHQWSFMEPLYDATGLSPNSVEDKLEFDQVRSELKYDDGITKLILNGKIKNKTKKSQNVPPIVATALGPDGHAIQSWQIDAPAARLGAGAEAPFASSINAPKGTVVNVIMNFAETKDDK